MKIFFYYLQDLDIDTGTPIRARYVIKLLSKKNEAVVAAENLTIPEIISQVNFFPIKKYSYLKGLNFFFKVRDLKRIIKKTKPDILYGFTCNSLFPMGLIAKDLKIPAVIEMQEPGHAYLDPNIIWRNILGFFEKKAIKRISGIVTVSSKIKDYYLNLAGNYNLPARVIYDGADISLFKPETLLAPQMQEFRTTGKTIIGYIGNFKAYQGIDFILKSALEIGEDFIYTMIGKDSEELRKKIAVYNLQNKVFLLGRKKYEEIPGYLKGMDIMLIPRPFNSITEYALPLKLFEYMAMGKAVVATDVGGAGEIIKDQENGLLIPAADIPKSLVKSFNLLKSNPELKRKIEENALNFIRNNLTWEKQAQKINDFLQEIYDKPC